MCGAAPLLCLLLCITAVLRTHGKVIAPAVLSVEAGQSLLLSCKIDMATGDTLHQVRWLDNDDKLLLAYATDLSKPPIVSHRAARVQLAEHRLDASSITISEVQGGDERCYRCTFDVFPSGSQEGETCVTVRGIVKLAGNRTAVSGRSVTLSCGYTFLDRVQQVIWKKTSEQGDTTDVAYRTINGHYSVVDKQLAPRVSLSKTLGETQLTFQPVRTEDEACYTCEFNIYPDGTKKATACLSIYVLPKPEVTQTTYPSGVIEANCTTQSRPAANVWWVMEGVNLTIGPPVLSTYEQGDGTTIVTSAIYAQEELLSQRSVKCVVQHPALEKLLTVPLDTKMSPVMVILLSVCGVAAVLLLCLCVCLCKCLVCTDD